MSDDNILETLVIFRRWKDTGSVIALFPELPADYQGQFCDAYEHIGQHGGACYYVVIQATKSATADESASLAKELTRIGYRLRPIKRASYKVHEARRATAKALK